MTSQIAAAIARDGKASLKRQHVWHRCQVCCIATCFAVIWIVAIIGLVVAITR